MFRKLFAAAAAAAALTCAAPSTASVLFSDDFNDGDISDWTASTNAPDGYVAQVIDAPVSGQPGLQLVLVRDFGAPTDPSLYVRASHQVDLEADEVIIAARYLTSSFTSANVSAVAFLDGQPLWSTQHQSTGPFGRTSIYRHITPGLHTLTLGLGIQGPPGSVFYFGLVDYDSVTIQTQPAGEPEPATWALAVVGFGGAGAALRVRRRSRPV
jgi:hypothetical protein